MIVTPPINAGGDRLSANMRSVVGGAAARGLGHYMPERAARFDAQAEEAAMSRLYGGIHFRHDNEDGLALGRRVAGAVINRAVSAEQPQPHQ